jgi:CRP-like cAMP-binding protein
VQAASAAACLLQETSLYRVPEGGVVGEVTVLRQLEGFGRGKRTENVWCGTACELLRVSADDITDLLQQYPALHSSLRQTSRSRAHRTQVRLAQASLLSFAVEVTRLLHNGAATETHLSCKGSLGACLITACRGASDFDIRLMCGFPPLVTDGCLLAGAGIWQIMLGR